MWPDSWDHWQYLALMGGCLLITLPLELVLRARVYQRPRRLLVALVPVVAIFSAWDVLGIWRDHWSYSARYTTGVHLPLGMPIEELVFFVVIPVCGLLTYEAVGTVLRLGRGATEQGQERSRA
ncbi:lycopene cyclase domain-containing protein [Arsenicicoccus cauae]|uniref:Lycopene cyclase domain-containing protein n=1 Tax=Arsenicicoccus cauae TaxID=2663847 RepID=A0A6I3ISE6_9MICO|nr:MULTISPECIES: lycopene cyclase domain-containing protein [Arsenicicoccus]AKT50674.1 lycopene cyclase [Arsenicicoccus sp. oral taxon 190]MTB71191.1 lycopene cyclase domain-containing protein [Arsenicicoccus cauae]